jgi:osmotically-inducible protein OsmY
MVLGPWIYPDDRYYYGWTAAQVPLEPSDGEIKSAVIGRLHENQHTREENIRVDVKQRVVILGGEVSSWLAKRAAGDDAWDTPGVVDVSNQLRPRSAANSGAATRP